MISPTISRFLVISACTAGLAALPLAASAQTGTTTKTPTPMTSSGTMGTHTQPMNHNMGSGTMGSSGMGSSNTGSGTMAQSGSMNMGSGGFDAHHYRTAADCLNAATAAHVSLSACSSLHNR